MIQKSPQNLWEKAASAFSPLSENNTFSSILLFFFLLVLPFQLGKHFWPSFAFVAGQRVDYLSPTIYMSDVAVFLLFFSALLKKQLRFGRLGILGLLGVILYFSFGIFFSQSPMNGWYMLSKLLELFFVGWYIARQGEKIITILFWSFSIDVVVEGVLGILQFLHQGFIGGLWYFLGERAFSASTPGIANASIHGQLVLRPYATFPHPNVFAGYLVIAMLFFLSYIVNVKQRWQKILTGVLLLFGFFVLLLTLSRVAIIVFILLSIILLVLRFRKLQSWIFLVSCCLFLGALLVFPLFAGRFLDISGYVESFQLRDILMQSAWWMFTNHPIFGVGLGNFLPSLPHYIPSKIIFGFLQPVHNIFLLVLAETGIVGLSSFVALFAFAFAESYKKVKRIRTSSLFVFSFFALLAICLIGITDHYFLTLQQGQLLLALVLGLCFA